MVKPEFLDFVNYNICKAYSEKYGSQESSKFFRRVGEIGFQELIRAEKIVFPNNEPYLVLKTIGKFLEDMGYMSKINLTKVEAEPLTVTTAS